MSTSVSGLLVEKYDIEIKPGGKAECPFCGHVTFSVKRDDTLGKCFHPTCGRFITAGPREHLYENNLHRVMEDIFQDFHANLLAQASAGGRNAYKYLVQERRIHPHVVADSMLGTVPPRYQCASKFDSVITVIEAALKANKTEAGCSGTDTLRTAEREIECMAKARDKVCNCIEGHGGWIAIFYTDAHHRIVAIRFREPYSKRILYFKPYKEIAGLFGHGLFTIDQSQDRKPLDDYLIVTEGEFNQLQLQSLALRYGEVTGQHTGYVFASSVGGVNNADYGAIRKTSQHAIFCYDNDSDGAGFALVNKAREMMSVDAFTTPQPNSDLDSFIRSFGDDHKTAWEAIKTLVAGRKTFPRTYSGTGKEFFRENTFIPKRLAEAIMERQNLRYAGGVLWIYSDGVYRSGGEAVCQTGSPGTPGRRAQGKSNH